MHNNKFVASSVNQKNVSSHIEIKELELVEELSEEEMMRVGGGVTANGGVNPPLVTDGRSNFYL
ncbi:MAG: hypothetical protein AB1589_28315 [Cyanobacteriota bacterium]